MRLPDLLKHYDHFTDLCRERLKTGEVRYGSAWEGRDNLREAEAEALDFGNYGFFDWLRAYLRREGRGTTRLVYVAGPYTSGDRMENIRAARDAGIELMRRGYIPVVMHTMYDLWDLGTGLVYEDFIKAGLTLVGLCESVLLLPGWENSPGAQREHRRAEELGLAVWTEIPEGPVDGITP